MRENTYIYEWIATLLYNWCKKMKVLLERIRYLHIVTHHFLSFQWKFPNYQTRTDWDNQNPEVLIFGTWVWMSKDQNEAEGKSHPSSPATSATLFRWKANTYLHPHYVIPEEVAGNGVKNWTQHIGVFSYLKTELYEYFSLFNSR